MVDFDIPLSRVGTHAEKYTARERLFGREDVMPFWVADMEFAVAPAIREALSVRVQHPIYGYTAVADGLLEAITAWNKKRYNLSFAAKALTLVPGVMSGVSAALYALSGRGDAVIVQPPLYPPIIQTVLNNGRRLVENPLVIKEGRYSINFEELDHLCKTLQPKILILCSPNNPVGRVWNREELSRLLKLTKRYKVYLVSDEIHEYQVLLARERLL